MLLTRARPLLDPCTIPPSGGAGGAGAGVRVAGGGGRGSRLRASARAPTCRADGHHHDDVGAHHDHSGEPRGLGVRLHRAGCVRHATLQHAPAPLPPLPPSTAALAYGTSRVIKWLGRRLACLLGKLTTCICRHRTVAWPCSQAHARGQAQPHSGADPFPPHTRRLLPSRGHGRSQDGDGCFSIADGRLFPFLLKN